MLVTGLDIKDVKLIVAKRFGDHRGFFSEVYNSKAFAEAGITASFVQDNHSLSLEKGTIRGLHFQSPPHAQSKLVRVVRGRILDIALDLRLASPTYGRHAMAELSAENWTQLFVPEGFAHGFCTLERDTEVHYKISNYYEPKSEAGVLWSDPDLAINWPVSASEAILSEKDAALPQLRDIGFPF